MMGVHGGRKYKPAGADSSRRKRGSIRGKGRHNTICKSAGYFRTGISTELLLYHWTFKGLLASALDSSPTDFPDP